MVGVLTDLLLLSTDVDIGASATPDRKENYE